MAFLESIKSWFVGKSQHFTHLTVDAARTDRAPGEAIVAGKGYFRLWLSQMFLEYRHVLFQNYSPVVHSVVRFQFGSPQGGSPTVEIPHIAGPLKLDIKKDALKNIIQRNYALTPLMPYHGGLMEVASGLSAIAEQENAGEVLQVMQEFSGMLAVPQLSAVLGIAPPLVKGVQAVANMGKEGLQLGLHDTFGAQSRITPGYFVVIASPESKVRKDELWVFNDELRIGRSKASTKPFVDASYMLFKIESMTERDDWKFLTSIHEPRKKAMDMFPNDPAQAEATYKTAVVAAWMSPELVDVDRKRVAKALREEFDAFKNDVGLGLTKEAPSLSDMVAAVSRADVAAHPPSLEELLR